jgi:hypothetical protein
MGQYRNPSGRRFLRRIAGSSARIRVTDLDSALTILLLILPFSSRTPGPSERRLTPFGTSRRDKHSNIDLTAATGSRSVKTSHTIRSSGSVPWALLVSTLSTTSTCVPSLNLYVRSSHANLIHRFGARHCDLKNTSLTHWNAHMADRPRKAASRDFVTGESDEFTRFRNAAARFDRAEISLAYRADGCNFGRRRKDGYHQ